MRHLDVHQDDVGGEGDGEPDRLETVLGDPDDLDPGGAGQERFERLREQRMVVRNQHAHRAHRGHNAASPGSVTRGRPVPRRCRPGDNATVADEVDRLYELPLEEFTAARNELAKRLGDTSVKQLKKPTVPAWTVNQLARTREVDVRRLLRAGEQLEQAQKQAVEGGDQKAFERARGAERDALRRLRSQAADLLRAGGHPANDSTLERVTSTLRAGSATEEGRARCARDA